MEYHTIKFLRDYNCPPRVLDGILHGNPEAILYFLKQWDFGGESEHTPQYTKPWGTDDKTKDFPAYGEWQYVVVWNSNLGHCGLIRCRPDVEGIGELLKNYEENPCTVNPPEKPYGRQKH